jgi:nicotinamide-nucleotide amidase
VTRFEPAVLALAEALRARHLQLTTAESCTGGLLAAACTSVAGSSEWFDGGFITYANHAKTQLLGVDAALITRCGAVSREVVCAMAEGALARSQAHVAVATTGIAGPGGATTGKPVGTVWLGVAQIGRATHAELLQLHGDRTTIRDDSVLRALRCLVERLSTQE